MLRKDLPPLLRGAISSNSGFKQQSLGRSISIIL
jgi:hypothetical protein